MILFVQHEWLGVLDVEHTVMDRGDVSCGLRLDFMGRGSGSTRGINEDKKEKEKETDAERLEVFSETHESIR